ncbi:MAG: SDR family oxidoreductase [Cryomorphaceae bacterium]|jgi:NAD(P)-dependent dehydrogenase (short-subunit alcohol dehydrogenase family)|nr:SDR family oxidoreductase [Cryomorphaceae bacterium]
MGNYLIIGGSSGIGKAIREQLHSQGHTVYATFFKNDSMKSDSNFHYLNVLSETPDLDFLPDTLDGFAYCPGAIDLKPFHRISEEAIMEDFNLQVLGAVRILKLILPKLKASGKGSVVFFSTVAVQTGFPFHAQVSISKGAIEGLARSLAAELAPTIRVNVIAPSLTHTPLAEKLLSSPEKIELNGQRHPMKRIGTPEDLAEASCFLLSDKSSWITGQIIHVDGGMSSLKIG